MIQVIYKMSLDKFGRSAAAPSNAKIHQQNWLQRGGGGFTYTKDGDIDIEGVKLCNVRLPTKDQDATTKEYVDLITINLNNKVNNLNETLGALHETVNDINDKVQRCMIRIQELDELSNGIAREIGEIDDMTRETKEKMSQLDKTWEERFKKMEQSNRKSK